MTGSNDSQLVAILLPAPAAVDAIRREWDHDHAVAVLDPRAPETTRTLEALAPTHVVDADGRRTISGGRPAGGPGAVVATSGTTGTPRFVELPMTALRASALAVHHALAVDPAADRWLACVPIHAIAGLAIVARSHLNGTPLDVHANFDVDAVARAAGRCSLVSLVPTTLDRLLDHDPTAASRFRCVLLGGAPIPAELRGRATAAGVPLVTTWGLTETGGGCVHDGHPLAGVDVDLASESGEVLVRGAVVMRGYRGIADDDDTWRNGWLRTGDVGRWTADGRLDVVDRIKDLVITGGVNVSPVTIERAYQPFASIADIAIIGATDADWGERVVACIVPVDRAAPPSLETLRDLGRGAGLRDAELPRELRLVTGIPRTPGGKILRRALRDGAVRNR